ncbi:MAG: restriction endonuclease [Actinobacteria bacterium]|nr:MAG: restriction endonuclease [Actinomycetota bacterium]
MTASAERAQLLEERIGDHFAAHGYVVRRNAYLDGRSGGTHEIDVLAEKSDPLTTFRLAVECKAWESPIEKDAVSKLSYVLADLGLNKGIIVALHGWRAGAEQAAVELGIDLWGPAELDQLLGRAVARQLDVGRPAQVARGYPFSASEERALARARAQGKGRLGLRTVEQLVWFDPVWVPVYLVALSITSMEVRWGRERFVTKSVTNTYEAVSGTFLGPASPEDGAAVDVDLSGGAIRPGVRDTRVATEIRRAFDRWNDVQQDASKRRHAAALEALGVDVPCRSVSVDGCCLVHVPTYIGWLRADEHERVVALSGVSGSVLDELSAVLTSHLSHVRSSVRGPGPRSGSAPAPRRR